MTEDEQDAPTDTRRRPRIGEDWASVILGLTLLVLILAEVVTEAWVP